MSIPAPEASAAAPKAWCLIWHDVLTAFSLLTRLPLPAHRYSGIRAAWAWPLVGAILGALTAVLLWLGQCFGLSPGPLAALALIMMALMTGALHEDGLSDTADGLIGGKDRDARLLIMKDSRIGSYGALALVLLCLANFAALSQLLGQGQGLAALIAAACLSRLPMVWLITLLPPARRAGQGLSAALGRPDLTTAGFATALALLIAVLALGPIALWLCLLGLLSALWLGWLAQTKIGGQTGDILGASQQIAFSLLLCIIA